jgi:hypothetical protein
MPAQQPVHVSVIGAGSTYGIYLVKWAYQLLKDPRGGEALSIPPVGSISYSNTNERNVARVPEVLVNDLKPMAGFENETAEQIKKSVRGYTRWRDMVAKEKPGLVVIGSPTDTHVAIARELITDFGVRNILCESPLTPLEDSDSLPGLKKMIEDNKVVFGVNMQYAGLAPMIKDLAVHPEESREEQKLYFRELAERVTAAEVSFITHGTRSWRGFSKINEQVILEDLGAHALYFLPSAVRQQPVTVKKVSREADDVLFNVLEYDLLFGKTPVRLVLGYRRKNKSLKVVFTAGGNDYEFQLSGSRNPKTGEFTRKLEGKNHAFPFRHDLAVDLVKYSFMRSLAGQPLVGIDEAVQNQTTLRAIRAASRKKK